MTWTYAGDPSQDNRSAVRFLVGDTDSADQQIQDEEIDWLLSQNGSDVYQAALAACTSLSARYARRANKTVGNLSIQYSNLAKQYDDQYKRIERQAARHTVPTPYAGGISNSDMLTDIDDTDLNQPAFSVGMTDNYVDPALWSEQSADGHQGY